MKRLVFLALLLCSVTASAQLFPLQPAENPPACEATVLHASFDRPARVMPVSDASVITTSQPNRPPKLHFELRNNSQSRIAGIDLLGRIKVKTNRYQLDSITRDIPMHLSSASGDQHYTLLESAVGFDSLYVTQVVFKDGTIWKPQHRFACGYQNPGSVLTAR